MNIELNGEGRNCAMAAHLRGPLWLAGGSGLIFLMK